MSFGHCKDCKNWSENAGNLSYDKRTRYGRCEEGISRIVPVAGVRDPTSDFGCTLFRPRNPISMVEDEQVGSLKVLRQVSDAGLLMERRYEIAKSNLAAMLQVEMSRDHLPYLAVRLADALLLALDQEKP